MLEPYLLSAISYDVLWFVHNGFWENKMLSPQRFEELQAASKIIESDAIEGIEAATRMVGKDAALAMLVLYLRMSLGSTNSWPADPSIDSQVEELLADVRLTLELV